MKIAACKDHKCIRFLPTYDEETENIRYRKQFFVL